MPLSEIGVLWIWIILISFFGLIVVQVFAQNDLREAPAFFGQLARLFWRWKPFDKEEVLFSQFAEEMLARLLRSGLDQATFQIGCKGDRQQVVFEKYIRASGDYGIQLAFPDDNWATEIFPNVQAYCTAHKIDFHVRSEGTKRPRRVLRVDCGRDVPAAVALACWLWTEVFGLAADVRRRFTYSRISPFGELIDRPGQTFMSFDEGWRYLHPDEAERPERTGCGEGVWSLYTAVVFFGLIVATLSAKAAAPEWSLVLAGVPAGGSTESLVFFCLFLFQLTFGRPIAKWLGMRSRLLGPQWLQSAARTWRRISFITLPIAVLLVWTGA